MKKGRIFLAVLLATGMLAGCGKHYEKIPVSTAETETTDQTDSIVIEPVIEITEAATSETKDEASLETPGGVWFDKDTMTAHGDIADPSEVETEAPGEEVDVMAPVYAHGTVVSAKDNAITVKRFLGTSGEDSRSPEELVIRIDPEQSVVVDAVNGFPVEPADIEEGSAFEAYLGPATTMSLPPQATAYAVIVGIPDDFKAPAFVIAEDSVLDTDNGKLLDVYGEQDYMLADNVDIQPYLTRNIVTLDDIHEGSKCLIWTDEYDTITKLVLFAE